MVAKPFCLHQPENAHGLERLVIGTSETQAVEVERVLNQLQRQIDRYRTLPPTWVREPSLAANH